MANRRFNFKETVIELKPTVWWLQESNRMQHRLSTAIRMMGCLSTCVHINQIRKCITSKSFWEISQSPNNAFKDLSEWGVVCCWFSKNACQQNYTFDLNELRNSRIRNYQEVLINIISNAFKLKRSRMRVPMLGFVGKCSVFTLYNKQLHLSIRQKDPMR